MPTSSKQCEAFDVLTDKIDETYDGILMLCVLQHFERSELDGVLQKLVNAVRHEGAMLLSYPLGDDEIWEHTSSGDYRVVRWSNSLLDERLQRAGFTVAWDKSDDGDEGPWRTVLARKTS